jgi:hypothetical protein
LSYFPTGSKGKEFLDASDIESVLVNELAKTLEPLQVIVREESFATSARWLDEALTFIDP